MNICVITNLFPNNMQPDRGVFNKQQFVEMAKTSTLHVVAPIPWVPKVFAVGYRKLFTQIKDKETIEGISVVHPRFFLTPKIGRMFYGWLMYLGIQKAVKKIFHQFNCDGILATWAFPDAYAAALLSKKLKKPLVIKVHGTDINNADKYFMRQKLIVKAMEQATKIIAVSNALKTKIIDMGIDEEKIDVISNGINKDIFRTLDKDQCRDKFGLDKSKKHVLYIGNLVPIKGVKYLIEAFKKVPKNIFLHIVGDGELKPLLEQQVRELNIVDQVNFQGRVPHQEIPFWLNASDIFCLPSLNEGCPNVILEALACGTPVVATNVGAIPDLVDNDQKGLLVNPADTNALSNALIEIADDDHQREDLQSSIMSWQENSQRVLSLLKGAMS